MNVMYAVLNKGFITAKINQTIQTHTSVIVSQYPKTITVLYFCTTFSQVQFSCLFLASLYPLPSPGQVIFFVSQYVMQSIPTVFLQ